MLLPAAKSKYLWLQCEDRQVRTCQSPEKQRKWKMACRRGQLGEKWRQW